MANIMRLSSLIPAGLVVESAAEEEGNIVVAARSAADRRQCPLCGHFSGRVHSRYVRTIADLPCAGRKVRRRLTARRFVREATSCRRRIFAERFEEGVVSERSRRTSRLECLVHHLGLALGGRPAAGFAKRLMAPVSNDTLLRVVRRRLKLPEEKCVRMRAVAAIVMTRMAGKESGGNISSKDGTPHVKMRGEGGAMPGSSQRRWHARTTGPIPFRVRASPATPGVQTQRGEATDGGFFG